MLKQIQRAASGVVTNPRLNALNYAQDTTQFSKVKLTNHGELETGEMPDALKYTRPCQISSISNGIRVATEPWKSPIATIGITIEAGSRNETIKNTGTAHFLEHVNFKGTTKRSRVKLESDVENIGGNLNAYTSRETTLYQMQVFPDQVESAFDILSDMLLNSKHEEQAITQERDVIMREAQEVEADTREMVLENVHYAAYRDHIMGQPILGNRNSIMSISQNDIKQFVATHYIAPRIIIAGAGNVEHQQMLDLSEKYFGKVAKSSSYEIVGEDTPVFTGSQVQIRDDDVDLAHMGIFYEAPSWKHEDYWAFLILQRIMGDYVPSRDSIINHPHLQYNHLHTYLGEIEDLGKHECLYVPYKDTGLFGHYASSTDMSAFWAPAGCLKATRRATSYVMDCELFRARNKLYHELMQIENGSDVVQNLGAQLLYMGRRVTRSEIAQRLASLDNRYLEKVYAKWLWDCELALAFYGPIFLNVRMYGIWRGYTNASNQI